MRKQKTTKTVRTLSQIAQREQEKFVGFVVRGGRMESFDEEYERLESQIRGVVEVQRALRELRAQLQIDVVPANEPDHVHRQRVGRLAAMEDASSAVDKLYEQYSAQQLRAAEDAAKERAQR